MITSFPRTVKGVSGPTYAGGNPEGKCKRSHIEAFYGYTGAFRCLVQGGGDVAFVKHTTVTENTSELSLPCRVVGGGV